MIKFSALFFLALTLAFPAKAQDYAKPTWPNLVRTLVRFNALSLDDDKIIDDFAAITECDLFQAMHGDDFKWNTVRTAIRNSVKKDIASFPINYGYETQLQLDHYDFNDKEYKLTDKTVIRNVNTFVIYQNEGWVCGTPIKNVPSAYRAVLDAPVSFEGLPLDEKDAEALLRRLKSHNNADKIMYARFNLRIVYIEPLKRVEIKGGGLSSGQANTLSNAMARVDAHLDSIDFYEDQGFTQLVYTFRP